jgi:hypothetical protein
MVLFEVVEDEGKSDSLRIMHRDGVLQTGNGKHLVQALCVSTPLDVKQYIFERKGHTHVVLYLHNEHKWRLSILR